MDPQIHLIDETWIEADPAVVSDEVADTANWFRWWPGLNLNVKRDRGLKGIQLAVSGELQGSVEIWLEPFKNGVILHHFVRLDPADGDRWTSRRASKTRRTIALRAKLEFWRLKDTLEGSR